MYTIAVLLHFTITMVLLRKELYLFYMTLINYGKNDREPFLYIQGSFYIQNNKAQQPY